MDTDKTVKVLGNNFVDASGFLSFDPQEAGINEKVHYPTLMAILDQDLNEDELKNALKESIDELIPDIL